MKIVLATIKHSQKNEYNIDVQLEEVEFDGKLETLASILEITEYKSEVYYNDGGGGGCPSTTIEIGQNYAMSSICDEHVYPIAFILDGVYFSGERKIALYGIEQMTGTAPVYELRDVQEKLIYPDHKR